MRTPYYATVLLLSSLFAAPAMGVEPIPGSIIYGGQPKTRLQKAPVGSLLTHEFYWNGTRYVETYAVQADRSLKLVDRVTQSNR